MIIKYEFRIRTLQISKYSKINFPITSSNLFVSVFIEGILIMFIFAGQLSVSLMN